MTVSHQSGTITSHWNDPPVTTFAKLTPTFAAQAPDSSADGSSQVALVDALSHLMALPTRLPVRNKLLLHQRLESLQRLLHSQPSPMTRYPPPHNWPRLSLVPQISSLETIIRLCLRGERRRAREELVELMTRERDIAAWVSAVRILVDNLE
jgi:hypothetical protein